MTLSRCIRRFSIRRRMQGDIFVHRITRTTGAHRQRIGQRIGQRVGQIDGAVRSLDQMRPQHTARVEESAAAAESLNDQADQLTTVVARLQVPRRPRAGFHRHPSSPIRLSEPTQGVTP